MDHKRLHDLLIDHKMLHEVLMNQKKTPRPTYESQRLHDFDEFQKFMAY